MFRRRCYTTGIQVRAGGRFGLCLPLTCIAEIPAAIRLGIDRLPNAKIEIAPPSAKRVVVLDAKSAFAAVSHQEMQRLAYLAMPFSGVDHASFSLTEQETPSLCEALVVLRQGGLSDILLLQLMLSIEQSSQPDSPSSGARRRPKTMPHDQSCHQTPLR